MVNKQVDAAFDSMLKEIENTIQILNQEGAGTFKAAIYES
jgi:hypothetical protein